jgi:hypothetical protein
LERGVEYWSGKAEFCLLLLGLGARDDVAGLPPKDGTRAQTLHGAVHRRSAKHISS